jgi:hypothetical protein
VAKRVDEPRRLVAHLGVAGVKQLDRLVELPVAAFPLLLDASEALLVALQRRFDRLQQGLQLGLVLLPLLDQPLIGTLQESVVRGLDRFPGKVAEPGLELAFELLQLGELGFECVAALLLAPLERGLGGGERFLFGAEAGELAFLTPCPLRERTKAGHFLQGGVALPRHLFQGHAEELGLAPALLGRGMSLFGVAATGAKLLAFQLERRQVPAGEHSAEREAEHEGRDGDDD